MYNAGAQVGPYTVVQKLGAGGMGEVYRALDTRLQRNVALKVLHPIFSRDPERLQRFEQEALATSKLNHPNIVGIYDFGEHDSSPYMVSELLEGQTLRQVLTTSRLSLRKVLQYASQIARGLAAAHTQGIVHRDLKPENIFVTKDGIVKILDFGIAKLAPPEARVGETQAYHEKPATQPGAVIGTPGYMSPEQIRGLNTDFRSDIFAFGAILYEMIVGQPAFKGDTPTDLIAAILRDDPPEIPPGYSVAPSLEAVIRHCLEKNPEERLQSARDIAFTLQDLLTAIQTQRRTPATLTQFLRWPWPLYAAVLLVVAVLAGMIWDRYFLHAQSRTPQQVIAPQVSSQAPDFQQVTFRRGAVHTARFSPDGNSVIYGAALNGQPLALFTSRAGGAEERQLDLLRANILAVSAKENMLIVLPDRNNTLAQVSLSGGTPHEIEQGIIYADWTPDESSLAVVREKDGKSLLESPIGHVLYSTAGRISHPRFSPDGKLIAFLDHPSLLDDGGNVAVVDRDGKVKTLSEDWSSIEGLAWSPTGNEVWFTAAKNGRNRGLWAASLNQQLRQLLITPDVLTLQDISHNQVLLTQENTQSEITGLLAGNKGERDFSWLNFSYGADLAADGGKILLTETGQTDGSRSAVYLRNSDASPPVRLGDGEALALSPDGQWAVARLRSSSDELILLPVDLGRQKEIKNDNIVAYHGAQWLRDSKQLVFAGNQSGHAIQLYLQSLEGGKPQAITPEGIDISGGFAVDPDGTSVAAKYAPDQKIYVYSFDGGEPQFVKGSGPDDRVLGWASVGYALYLQDAKQPGKIDRLEILSGRRRPLKTINSSGTDTIGSLLLTPDAKWYAYNSSQTRSNLFVVKNLQ